MHRLGLLWLAGVVSLVSGCDAAAEPAREAPSPSAVAEAAPKEAAPAPIKSAADAPAAKLDDLRTRKSGIDWPSFLGPNRDSKSPEKGIRKDWASGQLKIVWQRELGIGYGIGSTSLGRYFQFDRVGNRNTLFCLNAETGQELWKYDYPTKYEDILGYNNGPRCSPIVDGDRVYVMGQDGVLACVRMTDGGEVWRVDTNEKYGVVQNFFGVGSTPIVEGNLVICNIGGSPPNSPETYSGRVQGNGTGIVAFDKLTGEEKYRLTDELASYACPVVATIGGKRWGFVLARGGLVGFEPAAGKLAFHYPWRAESLESVNASTPIVFDDQVFISETYGPGSSLLRIVGDKEEVVWTDLERHRDKAMQTHWNTPIHHEGTIYGSSGRHTGNAELRAIDAKTGKVHWTEPGLTRCSLLHVDGHLVCLSENGILRLIEGTPERFREVTSIVLRDEAPVGRYAKYAEPEDRQLLRYPAWAAPILSHGLLYVRGDDMLVCLELIPKEAQ